MSTFTIEGRRRVTRVASDYLELVAQFPLHPIKTDAEYDKVAAIVDKLSIRDNLTPGEQDYLDALTLFISAYDDEHEHDPLQNVSPIEMLKGLMEHRGMTNTDLARVLGSKSAASEIVHGKRAFSKTHMAKLAAHFKVDAGVFLPRQSPR